MRPEKDDLENRNILKDDSVAPSLQAAKASLEKEQLADLLEKQVASRPDAAELVEKHILLEQEHEHEHGECCDHEHKEEEHEHEHEHGECCDHEHKEEAQDD